ncbi:MAG: SDR family oxidoreductase [Bacillota bacterium]
MNESIFTMFSLKGKVALITGASRGIGEEIATVYAKAGARVIICSRKEKEIKESAERIRSSGGEVLELAANVSVDEERTRLVKTAMDWAGKIDILVNNAGTNPGYGPLADISESAWDKVFEVNLKAPLFLSQLVYHAWMKDNGGVILNVASIGGFKTEKGINVYNISKAALIHLTRCLAGEWGRNGIRVNALAPGLIKTQFSYALWERLDETKVKSYPIPRIGTTDDIAGAALLLASDASSFITGHILIIDGGQLLTTG